MDFVAIDFETAIGQDSICAVGIATVEGGEIVEGWHRLIKPPGNAYSWRTTQVHGLTSTDTAGAPEFPEVYPEIKKRIMGRKVVAHNEAFDRNALRKTMLSHSLDYGELLLPEPWECTMRLYRQKGVRPCDLASLSGRFNIELNHHEAMSDARACAELYLKFHAERGASRI